MTTFPALSSGAIAQYPLQINFSWITQVVRFLDGTDQRCIVRARRLRYWVIKLSLLNDSELAQLEEFFDGQQGNFGLFNFPDPSSDQVIPNCRLASPQFSCLYVGPDHGSAGLTVMECYV